MDTWKERLALYDRIIDLSPLFDRKGKTVPYTSANGYMFSQLNKAGEIGIRLPKETQKAFREKYQTAEFRSYGAVMRDYVHVPESLFSEPEVIAQYLEEGFHFVMSLPLIPQKNE
ncbi:hypothetical protein KFE98_03095 [bacterium SCSIO 12741]|nr:hypothetical protein KFE98_03095 [bacterium SCSIO 12741]